MQRSSAHLLCVSLLLASVAFPVQSNAIGQKSASPTAATSMTTQQRGDHLRIDLQEKYASLEKSQLLKMPHQGRNLVTDIVAKYIPAGTTFDDAEAVLRAGGFKVSPRPTTRHEGAINYRDDVRGELALEQKIPSSIEAVITLSPVAIGDYRAVANVDAAIVVFSS